MGFDDRKSHLLCQLLKLPLSRGREGTEIFGAAQLFVILQALVIYHDIVP